MNTYQPAISIVDTHCHLDMDAYENDLDDVLRRADECGVHHTITIGTDLESSKAAVNLAKRYSCVSAAAGIHPHDVDRASNQTYNQLYDLIMHNRQYIVGYGEIGLDYVKKYSSVENQQHHFRHQLAFARELDLPVIIHDREAHEDTIRLIMEVGLPSSGGVMHCFSGDLSFAQKVMELGLFISIPGVVTFKNAHSLQDVARTLPLENLLVETDGPFLSPHPMRGKRNEPAHTVYTAKYIAQLRGISLEELVHQTTANSCRLFKLPPLQANRYSS